MSYIIIQKVDSFDTDAPFGIEYSEDFRPTHRLRDGEELIAACRLLMELDELDNGQAIVFWRVIN